MDIETFVERGLRHALTDRDWAHIELQALDVEAQLLAIKSLIRRNQQADEDLDQKIDNLRRQDQGRTGFWVDEIYQSFFQEAAHSMAAAGMLAPFIEAIFTAIFPCLPKEKKKKNQGIAKAIICLSKSKKLIHFFPEDFEKTIEALFLYRNKMFHNGLIWPENERKQFRIKKGGWPQSWFEETTDTEQPWIFYMSTEFIEHCLWTIEQVLDGYGKSLGTA